MERIRNRFWQMPDRLSPRRAQLTIGLAAVLLALALVTLAGGGGDGPPPLLSAGVLVLVGLGNLAWALGSLLPEAAGGRALRAATRPLFLLLLLASLAFLALLLKAAVVDGEGASRLIPAAAAGIAVHLAGRRQRQVRNGAPR